MDRITKGYMENFSVSQEILPGSLDESKLFEHFSCYCVLSREYSESFNLTDIVIGGGGDNGIDSIAIIANNVLIHSKEEFDDLVEQNKMIGDLKFVFIQSKTSSSFSGGDIATFGFGVRDVFSERPGMVQSFEMKEKSELFSHILSNMVHVKDKPRCLLYYVTNGHWCNDQNVVTRIEGVRSDLMSENLFSSVDFYPVDVDLLQKMYKSTIDKIECEIDFPERIPLPEMENINEAYLGILSAKQFLSLVSNEDGIIKSILYDNVRDYQGENAVNREIYDTLNSHNADKFVVLNNGVTIIAKGLRNVVRNRFLLTDYQIVNGCQTSHVLFSCKGVLSDKVYISVKIISTTDEETVNQVIKATNRQTEVTNEQLMALNDFHKKLEAYYLTYTGSQRLYYERRTKQYANMPDIEKVRIVSIATQIKAFSSMFDDKPHLASRYYGRLIKDSGDIFDDSHMPISYYTAAYTLYKIEFLIRNKQIDQTYNRYRYHILMILKYLILDEQQPPANSHKMERFCHKALKCLNDNNQLLHYIGKATDIISGQISDLSDPENAKIITVVDAMRSKAIALSGLEAVHA